MQLERNQKILVSKDVTADATGLADLANGEIVAIKPDGSLLTAGETIADAPYIYLVQGTDVLGDPKFSQKIVGTSVVNWTGKEYAAAVQQVSYIGYNGTNGTIEASSDIKASTEYMLYIIFKQDKTAFSERQLRVSFSSKTLSAGSSRETLVNDFVAQINASSICSQYLTAAKVGSGAGVGISYTAKAQAYKSIDGYDIVNFEVALGSGFTTNTQVDEYGYRYVGGAAGTTSSAVSVSPDKGVGSYYLVADMERFALGNNGITNRTKFPIPDGANNIQAVSTESYDVYVIDHNFVHSSANVNGFITEPLQTIIAVPYDAAANNGNLLEAILNPWMASCPGAFSAVNL